MDQAEPLETYSSSPHLYTDLDIPEGTKGRLPRNKRVLAGIDAEKLEDLGETGKSGGRRAPRSDSGQRSGGRSSDRGGRGSGAGGRSSREGSREGARRSPEKAAEAPAAASGESAKADRPRRNRSRTRRRNGEVVSKAPAAE